MILAEWSISGWGLVIFGVACFGVTMLFSGIIERIFGRM